MTDIENAARAMLVALREAEDYVQAFRDTDADILLTRVRAAIAAAEAVGVTVPSLGKE